MLGKSLSGNMKPSVEISMLISEGKLDEAEECFRTAIMTYEGPRSEMDRMGELVIGEICATESDERSPTEWGTVGARRAVKLLHVLRVARRGRTHNVYAYVLDRCIRDNDVDLAARVLAELVQEWAWEERVGSGEIVDEECSWLKKLPKDEPVAVKEGKSGILEWFGFGLRWNHRAEAQRRAACWAPQPISLNLYLRHFPVPSPTSVPSLVPFPHAYLLDAILANIVFDPSRPIEDFNKSASALAILANTVLARTLPLYDISKLLQAFQSLPLKPLVYPSVNSPDPDDDVSAQAHVKGAFSSLVWGLPSGRMDLNQKRYGLQYISEPSTISLLNVAVQNFRSPVLITKVLSYIQDSGFSRSKSLGVALMKAGSILRLDRYFQEGLRLSLDRTSKPDDTEHRPVKPVYGKRPAETNDLPLFPYNTQASFPPTLADAISSIESSSSPSSPAPRATVGSFAEFLRKSQDGEHSANVVVTMIEHLADNSRVDQILSLTDHLLPLGPNAGDSPPLRFDEPSVDRILSSLIFHLSRLSRTSRPSGKSYAGEVLPTVEMLMALVEMTRKSRTVRTVKLAEDAMVEFSKLLLRFGETDKCWLLYRGVAWEKWDDWSASQDQQYQDEMEDWEVSAREAGFEPMEHETQPQFHLRVQLEDPSFTTRTISSLPHTSWLSNLLAFTPSRPPPSSTLPVAAPGLINSPTEGSTLALMIFRHFAFHLPPSVFTPPTSLERLHLSDILRSRSPPPAQAELIDMFFHLARDLRALDAPVPSELLSHLASHSSTLDPLVEILAPNSRDPHFIMTYQTPPLPLTSDQTFIFDEREMDEIASEPMEPSSAIRHPSDWPLAILSILLSHSPSSSGSLALSTESNLSKGIPAGLWDRIKIFVHNFAIGRDGATLLHVGRLGPSVPFIPLAERKRFFDSASEVLAKSSSMESASRELARKGWWPGSSRDQADWLVGRIDSSKGGMLGIS
jgi:hypothetical protein